MLTPPNAYLQFFPPSNPLRFIKFNYKGLVYALTGALSLSFAALIVSLLPIPTLLAIFILISSAFSSFFIVETSLSKQCLFMLSCSLVVSVLSFLVLLINTHTTSGRCSSSSLFHYSYTQYPRSTPPQWLQ